MPPTRDMQKVLNKFSGWLEATFGGSGNPEIHDAWEACLEPRKKNQSVKHRKHILLVSLDFVCANQLCFKDDQFNFYSYDSPDVPKVTFCKKILDRSWMTSRQSSFQSGPGLSNWIHAGPTNGSHQLR
jgi:hypothetical protein